MSLEKKIKNILPPIPAAYKLGIASVGLGIIHGIADANGGGEQWHAALTYVPLTVQTCLGALALGVPGIKDGAVLGSAYAFLTLEKDDSLSMIALVTLMNGGAGAVIGGLCSALVGGLWGVTAAMLQSGSGYVIGYSVGWGIHTATRYV